jgi:hypothetical protein
MTTYSHTITLNDRQRIALEAALEVMIKHCDEHLSEGAPFIATAGVVRKLKRNSWNAHQ